MKTGFLSSATLAAALVLWAPIGTGQAPQDHRAPPTPQYPGATPPTFPSDSHPSSTMPPDTPAPPPLASSNDKVEKQIQTAMSRSDRLRNENVSVAVSDDSIELTGEASSDASRKFILRIATEFAGSRQVIDRLQIVPRR